MVVTARNKRWQDMDKGDTPLDRLARHFEAYNRSEGKSPKTVMWYSRVLRYFGDYLRQQNLPDTLENLHIDLLREFILYLQTKKKWDGHPQGAGRGEEDGLTERGPANSRRARSQHCSSLRVNDNSTTLEMARVSPRLHPKRYRTLVSNLDMQIQSELKDGVRDIDLKTTSVVSYTDQSGLPLIWTGVTAFIFMVP